MDGQKTPELKENLSFGMLKPDTIKRSLVEECFEIINFHKVRVLTSKRINLTKEDVLIMYAYAKEKPFFNDMLDFLTSGEVIIFVVEAEGEDSIKRMNYVVGYTDPKEAKPETLRALGTDIAQNIAHSSSNQQEVAKSIKHFFSEDELKALNLLK